MTDLFLLSNRLLTSGWWAYSRKPNYVADWIMSLTWGAIIGTTTVIPYFYSVFFITVLLHRCTRDFERYVLELIKKMLCLNLILRIQVLNQVWERLGTLLRSSQVQVYSWNILNFEPKSIWIYTIYTLQL